MAGFSDKNSPKIDDQATDGLSGVHNSLAYRTQEIERHLHSRERWLGLAGASEAWAPYGFTCW